MKSRCQLIIVYDERWHLIKNKEKDIKYLKYVHRKNNNQFYIPLRLRSQMHVFKFNTSEFDNTYLSVVYVNL